MQAEKTEFRLPRSLEILLAVVVLLELIAPFVSNTYGVDGGYHLGWIGEFTSLLARGVYLPRWIPEAYSGFGAPSFYFYPPLTYYIAYIFRAVTGVTNSMALFQMTGLFATIASFFSVRMLLSALGSEGYQKNIAALLYAFAPLRIAELYSRSNLSVHVGYIFLPLVWYGIAILLQSRSGSRVRGILILALSLSLLVITNIPLFLVSLTSIGVAAIVFYRRITRALIEEVACAALLVIMLSAFHYFTVLSFMHDANLSGLMVVQPAYLVTDLLRGANIPAAYHIVLIFAGIMLFGGAFLLLRRSKSSIDTRERTVIVIGLALASFVLFLGIPVISVPFWRFVPPLPLIQDSWRFYSCGLLFGVVMIAIASTPMMLKASKAIVWIWVLGAFVPIGLVVFHVHIYPHYDRTSDVATEYLTKYAVSQDSLVLTMKRHLNDAPALASLSDNEHVKLAAQGPAFETFETSLHSNHDVTFHRFYWPAWHLYANGQELKTWPDSIGRATSDLPAGNYQAIWKLERSVLERVGLWISCIAWSGVLMFSGIGLIRMRVRKKIPSQRDPNQSHSSTSTT